MRLCEARELDRVLGGHRVVERTGDREADAAEVEDRGADVEAVRDLAHAVVEDGVAGDPDGAVLLALPSEREADHVADERAAERRAVAAWGGGDLDRGLARGFEAGGLPGGEALGVGRALLRGAWRRAGRDDGAGARQQRAAGGVEVVLVVVVAEQDGVDGAEVVRCDRWAGELLRDVPQPKLYLRPGASNVGSVRIRHPPTSISAVGPPMCVMRMVLMAGEPMGGGVRGRQSTVRPLGPAPDRPYTRPSGAWRSLVARLLWEQEVLGSNPGAPMRAKPSLMRGFRVLG